MKKMPFIIALVMLFLLQCICSSPPPVPVTSPSETLPEPGITVDGPTPDNSVGTLDLVENQVESGPPENMQYLNGPQSFYSGYGVRVTGGGKGKLALNDGTKLTLFNETEVSGVTVTTSPREADLYLQRQGFLGDVPPGGEGVKVRTPGGVTIRILGTDFFILFDEQSQITVAGNFNGTVLFTPPGGVEQALGAGQLVDIRADGSAITDQIRFTPEEFEASADREGTPWVGLLVLRQRGPSPEPVATTVTPPTVIPTTVTPPAVGRWVGIREDLGGIMRGKPAVASWGPNRLDVFVRGTDDALWHKYWNGISWSGWESLGGILTSSPGAVSWGPNRIDVFVIGTTRHLWQKTWNGSNWSEWIDLGLLIDPDGVYIALGDPAVASWGEGRLDLFLGYSTDGGDTIDILSHQYWNTSGWSAGDTVGTSDSSGSATTRGVGWLDVVNSGPNNRVYYYQGDGNWQGPVDLGGYTQHAPAISSWGTNRLDLFIRGANNELLHKFWDGSTWSDWQYIDSPIYSAPAAVSWDIDRIDLFAASETGHLLHYWYTK